MRIVFVSNIFPPHVRGGYELGCQRIAERCHELGHEVTVLTSVAIGKLQKTARPPLLCVEELFEPVYEYEENVTELTCRQRTSGCYIRRQDAFGGILAHNAWTLARSLRRLVPDLIWIFNPLAIGTVGILEACLTSQAPCVLHLMDDIDDLVRGHQEEQYLLPRYRRLKCSIHAIACSGKMAIANTRIGEFASLRIIHNG
ncbi:MAG: glycosyltransferase, partial [Acidobacteriota bacterium]|nr:glycosyltransferase [Acidobacteriota bacterium]